MHLKSELVEGIMETLAVVFSAGTQGEALEAAVVHEQVVALRPRPKRVVVSSLQVCPHTHHIVRSKCISINCWTPRDRR